MSRPANSVLQTSPWKKRDTYVTFVTCTWIVFLCLFFSSLSVFLRPLFCFYLFKSLPLPPLAAHLALPHAAELHVVPGEDGEDPGGGGQPGQADHYQRPFLGPPPEIAQRRGDGPVSRRDNNKCAESCFLYVICMFQGCFKFFFVYSRIV